ncbi:MAG: L,D-transpeptidase, partial [Clostridia bacterium]|nr:L,D-transpeptidase [Clostridia bacterium]
LGQPASHGCIRLTMEDARWIYDHIPRGAPVHIY